MQLAGHLRITMLAALVAPAVALASGDTLSDADAMPEPNFRYFAVSGGYNGDDEKGVGMVSSGVHFGERQQFSIGVHHRQESHNTSYGLDLQGYLSLTPQDRLLLNGGIGAGRSYHDEVDRLDGNYASVMAGFMVAPKGLSSGVLFLNYTQQYAIDDNPDLGFSQVGYRFIF
ncbi:hypothetical protein [Vreelandella massiliensis]|uniref:hypothetical protein n=1 Tax=Vreelandella massiliensis TaxID=1816686 RepID=UPI00096A574B|nr:hypothetical protein [Halomonas massiliensis]